MKRTITEIFIEVEETLAVRQKAKSGAGENELRPANQTAFCPRCGQAMPETENEQIEDEQRDEN